MIFLIAGPRLRGTLVIVACIILVSELGLSVIVALRKAIPNSISLIFPITLPLARWGPPGHACMLHLETWVASPGQERPLLEGTGLSHNRFRVLSPPPQETEQWLQVCHVPQLPSTGHMSVLHLWIWVSGPPQALPPLEGRGLSHVRYRLICPPLHVRLHVPQPLQGLQLPWVGQGSLLQKSLWTPVPSHLFPPYCGTGSEQSLVLFLVPPPQDTVQVLQLAQVAHLPSTGQCLSLQTCIWVSAPLQ